MNNIYQNISLITYNVFCLPEKENINFESLGYYIKPKDFILEIKQIIHVKYSATVIFLFKTSTIGCIYFNTKSDLTFKNDLKKII